MPLTIEAITPDNRYAIGYEEHLGTTLERHKQLPIVRHFWLHGTHQRFVVHDLSTGERILASQWIPVFGDRILVVPGGGRIVTHRFLYEIWLWDLPLK
jgi:hypothetical protein